MCVQEADTIKLQELPSLTTQCSSIIFAKYSLPVRKYLRFPFGIRSQIQTNKYSVWIGWITDVSLFLFTKSTCTCTIYEKLSQARAVTATTCFVGKDKPAPISSYSHRITQFTSGCSMMYFSGLWKNTEACWAPAPLYCTANCGRGWKSLLKNSAILKNLGQLNVVFHLH